MATDQNSRLPDDLSRKVTVIRVAHGEFGAGFSPKLHLDRLAPAEETLFVDADCLCTRNLGPVFYRFAGRDVSVVGRMETSGELFGDIGFRCRAVGVRAVPRFCGGIYYLKRGPVSASVFETARQLEQRYDDLGIARLRGVANEEPLVALGMALHHQEPIAEDGTVKAEPMFFSGLTEIDVFAGYARLSNAPLVPKPSPEWQIPTEARPAIVHFNASFAEHPPYTVEALRMKLVMQKRWPLVLATLYAKATRGLPFSVVQKFKTTFRPFYRNYFGTRRVKSSPRIASAKETLR